MAHWQWQGWASILLKRTEHSFKKNGTFFPLFPVLLIRTFYSFQKNVPFFPVLLIRTFCSFPFFSKEHSVLFCSFEKNIPFFSVLLKRTFCSFHSFWFFLLISFLLKRMVHSFTKDVPLFSFFSALLKRTEHSFCFHGVQKTKKK